MRLIPIEATTYVTADYGIAKAEGQPSTRQGGLFFKIENLAATNMVNRAGK